MLNYLKIICEVNYRQQIFKRLPKKVNISSFLTQNLTLYLNTKTYTINSSFC